MRFLTSISLFLFFLSVSTAAFAEPSRPNKRPKIGLILEGGGARGFSHVGVLKVLEKNRIPVDFIAGTSMGSIVAAAYAAGRSPEEMEEVLGGTDWDYLLGEEIPRSDLPYRLKPGREREIFGSTKFSIQDGGLVLPGGLLQGQRILPILQNLYFDVPNPADFDKLPIPLRVVAADIETGKQYVFSKGDLARAVRASMSVPGAFAPVELDGHLLVDGGIANNLPVDQGLEAGADVLIVVEIEELFSSAKELKSPLAITGQMLGFLLEENAQRSIKMMRPQDVRIGIDLRGYSSGDFAKGKEIMEIGRKEAEESAGLLQKLSISEQDYAQYQRDRRRDAPKQVIEFIRLDNKSTIPDAEIMSQLSSKVGEVFDRKANDLDLERIYRDGRFSSVEYNYVEENGKQGLVISLRDKDWYKRFFRLGATVEDDFEGNTIFGLALDYRLNRLNKWGAYLSTEGQIGSNPNLNVEFYQPLGDDSPYFMAPLAKISRNKVPIRNDDNERIAEYDRLEMLGGLTAGRQLGSHGEFRSGILRGAGDFDRDIGDPQLPDVEYDIGEYYVGTFLDTLDSPDFPTSGYNLNVAYQQSLEDLGASDDFDQITGGFGLPLTKGNGTLVLGSTFGASLSERPVERFFSLGGFLDISGYERNGLSASDYVLGRAIYFYQFSEIKLPFFGFGFFAGGSVELAHLQSDFQNLSDPGVITAGSTFLGIDTPLIPIYLALGMAEEGETAAYVILGRIGARRR